jgi:hypothetical protein
MSPIGDRVERLWARLIGSIRLEVEVEPGMVLEFEAAQHAIVFAADDDIGRRELQHFEVARFWGACWGRAVDASSPKVTSRT